jgi:hypothetical protein
VLQGFVNVIEIFRRVGGDSQAFVSSLPAMSAPRRIVVDDTDSAIQYGSSEWSVADSTKLNTLGNFGPVYNGSY